MRSHISRIVAPALVAGALLAQGCSMSFKQTEQITLDDGYKATQAALGDLQFSIKDQGKDALQAHVDAEQSDKTPVSVNLESKSEHVTEFRIKVGVLGDDD